MATSSGRRLTFRFNRNGTPPKAKTVSPNPKKRKYADINTVTLCVGKSNTAYHVHEHLLTEQSSFFKAAFESNFREGTERQMRLSEDRSVDFENFVRWLYAHDNQNSGSLPNSSYNLIRLYVVAEKYDIPALKKCICDRMILGAKDKGSRPPGWDSIAYAYEYLPATSSLLKLLIDWHAWDMCLGLAIIKTEKKELAENPKFAVDLVYATAKTARYRPHKGLFFWDTSEYYEKTTITSEQTE